MVFHSKSNDLLRIAAFPRGKTKWRVSWFGEVAFPNRVLRMRQPSVLVYLTSVKSNGFGKEVSGHYQKSVWVSIGALIFLRVGDIWQDGYLYQPVDDEIVDFIGLQINPQTVNYIKAGLSLEDGSFLLPAAEHPWHMASTHSYCLAVSLPGDKRLVIPCMELARFYFGSSTTLLGKLFSPPLERSSLYSNPIYEPLEQRLTIDLADGISGRSAADIGRLHQDPVAWRAAVRIGTSMLQKSTTRQPCHIQTMFPFEGKTNLKVSGKWLSLGGQPKRTFIAHSIRLCSHPFPFKELRYNMNTVAYVPAGEQAAKDPSTPSLARGAPDADRQGLVEKDAGSFAQKNKVFKSPIRFPDLIKKPVYRSNASRRQEVNYLSAKAVLESIASASMGGAGSSERVRPMEISLDQDSRCSEWQAVPEFLRELLDEIENFDPDWDVRVLTHDETSAWTVAAPVISDEYGQIDEHLIIRGPDRTQRLRRVAVFLVSKGIFHHHMVVVEGKPPYIVSCKAKRRSREDYRANVKMVLKKFIRGEPASGLFFQLLIKGVEIASNFKEITMRWLIN